MAATYIRDLFACDISREIEEIIKVDQADERLVRDELNEYVVTDALRRYFAEILERYLETKNKPHEGIGVWVSGFFGSGKSSFAKYLGLALEDRQLLGESAGEILGRRANDQRVQVLLKNISELVPTEAVIFDVSTDRGIRWGGQSIIEIMYRLFLQQLGYAHDLDLSELEVTLEGEGQLEQFQAKYREVFDREWDAEKGKVAIAVQQASRVMHELDPGTYPTADSWRESAMRRADVTAGKLAERCKELMARRRPGKTLVFVVDEVGQFVARDVQKMLDLQAVVQNLGRVGRGSMWLVVTSQEKLTELVGGLDDRRVELARLMDRFPLQVHLEPSDISEVTSKRVLAKNPTAETQLRDLFDQHSGRLADSTRVTADIKLPPLTREAFVDLYPLLPYQVDLIIQLVSGLRTQGGASRHVGGAARTIIKLAQQLLIHPGVDLAAEPVGALVQLDEVYDLVAANISSEVRGKIDDIGRKVDHPMAQTVAKAVALLQYVRSIHCSAENIAATLFPAVDGDSRLPEVKDALAALETATMVRHGDRGYRIPTPAEDDWERQRASLQPKPSDANRLYQEVLVSFWQPQPAHKLMNVKQFKAGLWFKSRAVVDGDIPIHVTLAQPGGEAAQADEEARGRSRTERGAVFWTAEFSEQVDREMQEFFRSREMLSRKERGAQTKDETALVHEERVRQGRHRDRLQAALREGLLNGHIFFRGNDRSPDESAKDVRGVAEGLLSQVLPDVFDRFDEAAAKVSSKDLEAVLTAESLLALPSVFADLGLVQDKAGMPAFNVEAGPLAEVMRRIDDRTNYGETASGKYLTSEFEKEPFGWEFDVVRLLVACLLRAGSVEMTSRGQVVKSARTLEARTTLTNNSIFRQASFRPAQEEDGCDFIGAYEHYREVFGRDIAELTLSAVASATRSAVSESTPRVDETATVLRRHALPGGDLLENALGEMSSIGRGDDCDVVATFNAAYRDIADAMKRSAELEQALHPVALETLRSARRVLDQIWPVLRDEPDIDEPLQEAAANLAELLSRETFYRELAPIEQDARQIRSVYSARHAEAVAKRVGSYAKAVEGLRATKGWELLTPEQQQLVEAPLTRRATTEGTDSLSIPMLREQTTAAGSMLRAATEEAMRLVDGGRVEVVSASAFFSGGIETEQQLDAAIDGLRQAVLELIAEGKKALIQ